MKTSVKNFQTIDQELNTILRLLAATAGETMTVVRDRPAKGSSCKGMISLYRRADLMRQNEDSRFKATPTTRYAFYPDTYNPSRLGSIAIYGADATPLCALLKKKGHLFGHPILSATLEQGRRPFVDVMLRA